MVGQWLFVGTAVGTGRATGGLGGGYVGASTSW